MPRSKTGKTRLPVDSNAIENAVKAVLSGDKRISLREACKVYKVSLTTLSRHLRKFKESGAKQFSYLVKYDVKRIFTNEEEKTLVQYIQTIARMQYGLTKKGVRELSYRFAKANKKKFPPKWEQDNMAGEEWMRLFMGRHNKSLSLRKPEPTSLSRSTSFNKTNVEKFFDNLEVVHSRFGPIPPERIWNTDEKALTTVQKPSKVVAPLGEKQIGSVTSAERGQLVTLIAAINAIGNHIPPMLIFPRVHFKDFMTNGAPPGTIGDTNPSGWSTEVIFKNFLKHFAKHVKPSKEERVLLVLDNHETHLSVEAVEFASEVGIVMLTFPPHTSNKFQPLDLTVYGPLQTFYDQAVDAWLKNNPGKTFDIYSIAEMLGIAYPRAFTTSNIVSGFRKPGIFPFDRSLFSEQDFLVSYVTDRIDPTIRPASSSSTELQQSSPIENSKQPSTTLPNNKDPLPNITFISPEQIQPYPKAAPRKTNKRGRKLGATRIVTDTPEKEEIRRNKEKRAKNKDKKSPVKKSKRQVLQSDSEEDSDEISLQDEDGDPESLLDLVEEEIMAIQDQDQFESCSYEIGDYVLIQFPKKKAAPDHFVGNIVSKDVSDSEFQIKFYKRIESSSKFIQESNQTYDVNEQDIILKLPKPLPMAGSNRLAGQLCFPVDFTNFNVK